VNKIGGSGSNEPPIFNSRKCYYTKNLGNFEIVAKLYIYIYIYRVETGNTYGEGETIYAQNDKTWVPDLRTRSSPPLKNTTYWTYKKNLNCFWVASKHSTYYPNLRLNQGQDESKFNISLVNY
jgi:hypothetical protein